MSRKIIKTIRAGRLVRQVIYPAASIADEPRVRKGKQKVSTAGRQLLNFRTAGEKLEALLAANFDEADYFVTLTYDDAHLPPDRDGAKAEFKKYVVSLRRHLKKNGLTLRYVYTTEEMEEEHAGERRLHHHAVISGDGLDPDTLRAVWGRGFVHVEPLLDGAYDGYATRAQYLIKERHPGQPGRKTGLRAWSASHNLQRPEVTTEAVPEYVTLTVPAEAYVLDSREEHNVYGEFVYLKYLTPVRPKPKRRKRS